MDRDGTSGRDFVWDPRKMIGDPFAPCPSCQAIEFGTLMISGRSWTRRCRACLFTASRRLPELSKRVIYLDQMVFSNIAKALDPVWAATRKSQDSYWLELFDQLERLVKLQLAVCPSSPIHDRESSVTPYADVLLRLRQYLSTGVEFETDTIVLQRQLHHALNAILEDGEPSYFGEVPAEVLHGRFREWTDRLQISVKFPTPQTEIQERRMSRDSAGESLKAVWTRWRTNPARSFDEYYQHERRGAYHSWVQLYNEHIQRYARVAAGLAGFDEETINPRLAVTAVMGLLMRLQETGLDRSQAHERLATFFKSDAALDAPANDISSLLMAALARKAVSGQKKAPNRGSWNDIMAISAYLPYCDVMFIDDQFAGLLREQPLRKRLARFPAHVFSNRNRKDFLKYLADIEKAAPNDHISMVHEIYGDRWLTPFREILRHQRERKGQ